MYKTMAEIEKEYDGNWVCIVNCRKDEYHDIVGGEVLAFGKDKFEIQDVWGATPESLYRYFGDFSQGAGGYLL